MPPAAEALELLTTVRTFRSASATSNWLAQQKTGDEPVPKPTFNPSSTAIANWVLTVSLIASLRQNQILTHDQANEVVEQTLLNLERLQGSTRSAAFKEARAMLEDFRLAISEDRDLAPSRTRKK
jgi:hypothetical protein